MQCPGLLPAPGAADEPPSKRQLGRRARSLTSGFCEGRVSPCRGDSSLEAAAQKPAVGLKPASLASPSASGEGAPPTSQMSAVRRLQLL
ncbi:hypothetical protein NDU88_002908 [Pleurodeles waltl]|uniref:Uncharacterized protein n=1 Tax=Pleurodeles waltl TaxID=8319 RepID=A0AAV7NN92_PLEWA|nr:hypothetical protein NDU88_002908 [Pleurodeles waltl]